MIRSLSAIVSQKRRTHPFCCLHPQGCQNNLCMALGSGWISVHLFIYLSACFSVCLFLPVCILILQRRVSTYVWLLLGYPPLVVIHSLVCFISWILVFTIPVAKMHARTIWVILLVPEDISVSHFSEKKVKSTHCSSLTPNVIHWHCLICP